jgi:hypothetical protein
VKIVAKITVTKMEKPEQSGDWHDQPVRWQVNGPKTEVQKFSTKADATLYARLRRNSSDFNEASEAYLRANLFRNQ